MALRVSIFLKDVASSKLGKIAGKVTNLGKNFVKFGALAATAIAGISTKLAGDFDKGLREVSTLMTKVTEKDIKTMGKELEALSGKTGLAINSLVKARYDIVSAGFADAAQSAIVLGEASKLAVGGVTTAAAAADLLTTALNAYDKTAEDATDISDILFTTVRLGKTTMTELAASMGNMLPIAKAANVRLEDAAASLALVTANGIDTATASTSLKNAFKNLAAPTDDAKAAMDAAGITVKKFEDGTVDLVSTMKQFKGLPLDALKEFIPDIRAINAIQILSDKVDGLADNIGAMDERANAAKIAFDKMQLSFNTKLDRLKNNFARIFREIGRQIMSVLSPVVDEANKILEDLGDIGWDQVVATIGKSWAQLKPIFDQILKEILKPIPALFSAVMKMAAKGAFISFKLAWAAMGSVKDLLFPGDEAENLALLFGAVGGEAAKKFLETGKFEELGPEIAKVFAEGTREEMLAQAEKLGIKEAVDIALGSIGFVGKEEGAQIMENLKSGLDTTDMVTAFGEDFKGKIAGLDLSSISLDLNNIFGDPGAGLDAIIAKINEAVKIIQDAQVAITDNDAIENEKQQAILAAAHEQKLASWAAFFESLYGAKSESEIQLYDVEKENFVKRLDAFNQYAAVKQDAFKVLYKTEMDLGKTVAQGLGNISTGLMNLEKANIQKKLDADINAVLDSTKSEEDKNAAIKILKEKALQDEKSYAKELKPIRMAQAIANGALAIINALTAKPFIPVGVAAGAMAAVATGLQIATIAAQPYAQGGKVMSFANGGAVPSSDTVPALLTPGEFVSTRAAAQQFGPELNRLNQEADGGSPAGGGGDTFNITIPAIDGESVYNMIINNKEETADGLRELAKTGHIDN
jgi:TP901 family phage tail tape measure protein